VAAEDVQILIQTFDAILSRKDPKLTVTVVLPNVLAPLDTVAGEVVTVVNVDGELPVP
jgi:hypothetical protein